MTDEERKEVEMNPTYEYKYLKPDDHIKMTQKVEHLQKVIKEMHPKLDLSIYKLLDHQDGRCDYDPYDTNQEIEFHDEGDRFTFPEMYSDGIMPDDYVNEDAYNTYMENYNEEQEENQDWPEDDGSYDNQSEESYDDYAQDDEYAN